MPSYLYHHSKRGVSSGKCRAFTLTELFVCVLIVFVVGLVLLPLLAKCGSRSRPASCGSNQKQIALAFLQYIQDYDDRFPPAMGRVKRHATTDMASAFKIYDQNWGLDNPLPDGRVIAGFVSPYIKASQLFIDPAGEHPRRDKPILEYMYNDLLVHEKQGGIASVSTTVLIVDSENRWANAGHAYSPDYGPFDARFNDQGGCDTGKGATIRMARFWHQNGANVSFVDGHVMWFKGGTDDPIFFPPRESASVAAIDPDTKQQIGPIPGGDMSFQRRHYAGTFHIR